jgi:hypothetical protein
MAEQFSTQWEGGLQRFRQRISSKQMADAYMSGDYSGLIKQVPFRHMKRFFNQAVNNIKDALETGAKRAFTAVPDQRLLRLDLKNVAVERYIDARAGAMIQLVNDQFHQTVGNLVRSRFAHGTSTANMQMGMLDRTTRHGVAGFVLKNSVGLDTRSATALANRAASGKYNQRELDDYENELHVRRAGLIARTEVSMALNEGQKQVWSQAAEQGLIDRTVARKVWIVDGNPCPKICEPMDGISVPIDEEFLLPNGERVSGPSAHPRCQCLMQLDVDGDDDVGGSNRQNYRDDDEDEDDEAR